VSYYLPDVRFRPIDAWPGPLLRWDERRRAQFRAAWPKTIALLNRELAHLQAEDVILQVAMTERDIRLDGYPRANARAEHPGVILAFNSRYGPLKYATDTYDDWQDNIRAIALGLEALRAVDRYGVTKRGEQYRGWQALPAPANGTMSVEQAARFIAEQSGVNLNAHEVLTHGGMRADAYRSAARRLHPDTGGSHELFTRLQEAKRVLNEHGAS
jgi:hypothetical protein